MNNNASMFSADVIRAPLVEKMNKYKVTDSNGDALNPKNSQKDFMAQLIDITQGLQKQLDKNDFKDANGNFDEDAYFAEVSKRADVLNAIKDSFEEIAKQQYKGAEIADARAKKAQAAINNNEKKS